MKIFLYVGLPKTATTFYQSNLFPLLNQNIIYNPFRLMVKLQYFLDLKNIENIDIQRVNDFKNEIELLKKNNPNHNLLIVNEHLGYSGFNPNPKVGAKLTKQLFDDATIIISLRFQTDWLLSSYRHYMDNGGSENILKFLNYKNASFERGLGVDSYDHLNNLFRRFDIHLLDWHQYIDSFCKYYQKKNIHVLFFEDFIEDMNFYTNNICKIIQVEGMIPKINFKNIKNKGRSAFTCQLIQMKVKAYMLFGIKSRSIPVFNKKLEKLRNHYYKNTTRFSKIIFYFNLIFVILKYAPFQFYLTRFDNLIYIDWDMLRQKDLRKKLDYIFKNKNTKLLKLLEASDIPHKYLN